MKKLGLLACLVSFSILPTLRTAVAASTSPPQAPVDIVRGTGGVPQIFSRTDAGAFFGLGYATASDRLFQMEFTRAVMRGTLSALLPAPVANDPYAAMRDTALWIDKRARYVDWPGRATLCIQSMTASDPALVALLQAYCDGVNRRKSEIPGTYPWPPMFQAYVLTQMNDWTPEDCLLAWLRIEQHFEGAIETEVARSFSSLPLYPVKVDDTGAVCSGNYLALCFLENLWCDTDARSTPLPGLPKASHNVVIAGNHTATGMPMILGKPQLAVTAPNIHYEYSLHAENNGVVTLDCRGVGFPGCPGILHGWNRHVAWTVTVSGCDNRDAYLLQMSQTNPYGYYVDGQPHTIQHSTATILDRANTVLAQFERGETLWGPWISQYVYEKLAPLAIQDPAPEFAYHSASLVSTQSGRHSMRAMLGFMRAQNICGLRTAMNDWGGPPVNIIYADDEVLSPLLLHGNIGFTALMTCPQRPAGQEGRLPLDGSLSTSAWGPSIPYADLPHERNPSQGFLSTANNLGAPNTSWFYLTYHTVLGAPGDTGRSWRLREFWANRLASSSSTPVTWQEVQDFDHDTVVAPMRALKTLANACDVVQQFTGSAQIALATLNAWTPAVPGTLEATSTSTSTPAMCTLFNYINRFVQVNNPNPPQWQLNLAAAHGDGETGVCNLFKKAEQNGTKSMQLYANDPDVRAWLQARLTLAGNNTASNYPNPFTVRYQTNTEGFPGSVTSIDPGQGSDSVTLQMVSASSIWSQGGECYKLIGDLQNPDNNLSLLGYGISEDPASPNFSVNRAKWIAGRTRPAPLTRSLIPGATTTTIYY